MRKLLSTGVLCFTTVIYTIANESTESIVRRWLWDRGTFKPEVLDQETRVQAISELKKHDDPANVVQQDIARRYLIELGDLDTAEKVVGALSSTWEESHRAEGVLRGVTQPWVIPMLIPVLMHDEIIENQYPGSSDRLPQSASAAICILVIAQRSPDFSEEVRASAKKAEWAPNIETYRTLARHWWEQNKQHFEKEDYAAVRPIQTAALANPQTPVPSEPVAQSPAVEAASPTQMPVAPSQPLSASEPSPSSPLRTVAIIFVVLATIVAVWRLARRKRV